MILFLTHEKDFFAKQCYLMLKYQYQLPTRWLTWQIFKKQSQCYSVGYSSEFNPILPPPHQVDVLYINLNGLNNEQIKKNTIFDKRYLLHSWLGFLMWYAKQVNFCINPMNHQCFSPGIWTKHNIRRHASSFGLNVCSAQSKGAEFVCSILGNQILVEDTLFLKMLGHQKIKAIFRLFNTLDLVFGQVIFDESNYLCKLSPIIQFKISVPVIIKACHFMMSHISSKGFQYISALESNEGWTISPKIRPTIF